MEGDTSSIKKTWSKYEIQLIWGIKTIVDTIWKRQLHSTVETWFQDNQMYED